MWEMRGLQNFGFFFFFANICAQSFYSSSPMGEKDLYTGGPHGLLSCFITNEIPGIL